MGPDRADRADRADSRSDRLGFEFRSARFRVPIGSNMRSIGSSSRADREFELAPYRLVLRPIGSVGSVGSIGSISPPPPLLGWRQSHQNLPRSQSGLALPCPLQLAAVRRTVRVGLRLAMAHIELAVSLCMKRTIRPGVLAGERRALSAPPVPVSGPAQGHKGRWRMHAAAPTPAPLVAAPGAPLARAWARHLARRAHRMPSGD